MEQNQKVEGQGAVEGGALKSTDSKDTNVVKNPPADTGKGAEITAKLAEDQKRREEAESAKAKEDLLKKQAEERKKEGVSIGQALATPDGERRKGKDVKEGQLVRTVYADQMTDSLTLVQYTKSSWTEAKPSIWLDGQLKAGKIEVKG